MAPISIDTNLYSLRQKLNITSERMQNYTDKTVDEIIQSEAAQGNQVAVNFARELEHDPQALIETYKLDEPGNKFNIMCGIPEQKRPELLQYLEDADLRMGLYFFTQENLLKLMEEYAPIEEIVYAALICFKLEDIMKMMPDEELNNFVLNKELDPEFLKKNLEMMPPEVIAVMIEAATGSPVMEEDPQKLIQMLYGLDKDTYQEALIAMNPDAKRVMVMNMYQQDEEVLQLFPAESYIAMLGILEKEEMMPCVNAFQTETLINMDSQLPPELMAIVLTQMDPKVLAQLLIKDYPELLNQIVAV